MVLVQVGNRLMVVPPRLRNIYLDSDDEEDDTDTYVPSYRRPRPVSSYRVTSYLDDVCSSPQMEEIEFETRKIKRDAAAVLQRLGQSYKKRPTLLSSVYCPDLTYTSTSSSSMSSSSNYVPRTYSSSSYRASADRDVTPGLDTYRPARAYTHTSSRILVDPIAKVQSEINRKAIYSESCRKINDSVRGSVRRVKRESDADTVKNNINFRAQYASLRAAANVGVRKNNDYLMV